MMALYEEVDLKISHGTKLSHLGFQRYRNTKSKGYALQLGVDMGKSVRSVANAFAEYDKNYVSGTKSRVFGGSAGKRLNLPDLGGSVANPNPNDPFVWIPLDVGWVHDNTKNISSGGTGR